MEPQPEQNDAILIPPTESTELRKRGSRDWEELLRVLERIPFISGLGRDIATLRRLVYQRRPPRILAIGAPGSGRSQLLGALLGVHCPVQDAQGWQRLEAAGHRLQWLELDVPPPPTADAPKPVDPEPTVHAFRDAIAKDLPDAVLLLATPSEVEEGLGMHLDVLNQCLGSLPVEGPDKAPVKPVVLPVMTQVDTLPPEQAAAPFPDEKRFRIQALQKRFARQLEEANLGRLRVHSISTPTNAERRLGIEPWNLEALLSALADAMPEAAKIETVRSFQVNEAIIEEVALEVVRAFSRLSTTVALSPVPLSDLAILMPLQTTMVSSIAYLAGRRWERRTFAEAVASLGIVGSAGLGFRWGAQQLLKVLPGSGMIISGGIAGTGTLALGRAAMRYYLGSAT